MVCAFSKMYILHTIMNIALWLFSDQHEEYVIWKWSHLGQRWSLTCELLTVEWWKQFVGGTERERWHFQFLKENKSRMFIWVLFSVMNKTHSKKNVLNFYTLLLILGQKKAQMKCRLKRIITQADIYTTHLLFSLSNSVFALSAAIRDNHHYDAAFSHLHSLT